MKIEKVNDNQIRCTLTKEDLANRHLKLSELAYGTEKAKMLFHDMMQQANYEFGFETDDLPLMIEAIPVSSDSIVLLITKVEYPDELDTRFSKFSESSEDFDSESRPSHRIVEGADDILDIFRKKVNNPELLAKYAKADHSGEKKSEVSVESSSEEEKETAEEDAIQIPTDLTRLFTFRHLDELNRLAIVLDQFYSGENSLYKNVQTNRYYLILHKSNMSPEVFNKVCNILSEYSHQEPMSNGTEPFFLEHLKVIIKNHALQTIAQLH